MDALNLNPLEDVLAAYNDPEIILDKKGGMDPNMQVKKIFMVGRSAFQIISVRSRGRLSIKFVGNVYVKENAKQAGEIREIGSVQEEEGTQANIGEYDE